MNADHGRHVSLGTWTVILISISCVLMSGLWCLDQWQRLRKAKDAWLKREMAFLEAGRLQKDHDEWMAREEVARAGFSWDWVDGEPREMLELATGIRDATHRFRNLFAARGVRLVHQGESFGFGELKDSIDLKEDPGRVQILSRQRLVTEAMLSLVVECEIHAFLGIGLSGSMEKRQNPGKAAVHPGGASDDAQGGLPPFRMELSWEGYTGSLRCFLNGMREIKPAVVLSAVRASAVGAGSQANGLTRSGRRGGHDARRMPSERMPLSFSRFWEHEGGSVKDGELEPIGESDPVAKRSLSRFVVEFWVLDGDWGEIPPLHEVPRGESLAEIRAMGPQDGGDDLGRFEVFSPPGIYRHPDSGEWIPEPYRAPRTLAHPEIDAVESRPVPFAWKIVGYVEDERGTVLLLKPLEGGEGLRKLELFGTSQRGIDGWEVEECRWDEVVSDDGSITRGPVLTLHHPVIGDRVYLRLGSSANTGQYHYLLREGELSHPLSPEGRWDSPDGWQVVMKTVDRDEGEAVVELWHPETEQGIEIRLPIIGQESGMRKDAP